MKATVDIPDELYRQVKAKSALEGRPIREVAVELFQGYVGQRASVPAAANRGGRTLLSDGKPAPSWFGLARKHMRKAVDHGMDVVRESIERGWAQEVAESEATPRKTRKR
jgi:hypothetical protein